MNWDNYDWYLIFNLAEWIATGLVQRTLKLDMEGLGRQEILITQGNTTAILWEDKFLPINFLEQNPYVEDGVAVYKDDNDEVYIGFEVDE